MGRESEGWRRACAQGLFGRAHPAPASSLFITVAQSRRPGEALPKGPSDKGERGWETAADVKKIKFK